MRNNELHFIDSNYLKFDSTIPPTQKIKNIRKGPEYQAIIPTKLTDKNQITEKLKNKIISLEARQLNEAVKGQQGEYQKLEEKFKAVMGRKDDELLGKVLKEYRNYKK